MVTGTILVQALAKLCLAGLFGEVSSQFFRTTDVFATDEHLWCSGFACDGANRHGRSIGAQDDFFIGQALFFQQGFGFGAVLATWFGEYAH